MGENVFVGGKGDIEILRQLNSLTGVDAKDFSVNVGELPLRFSEDEMHISRNSHNIKNTFNIEAIALMQGGELVDATAGSKTSPYFRIDAEAGDGEFFDESKIFVAGRETFLGPYGSFVDLHIDVSEEHLKKIQEEMKSVSDLGAKDAFIAVMLNPKTISDETIPGFEFKIDTYVPIKGVALNAQKTKEIFSKIIWPKLIKEIVLDYPLIKDSKLGELKVKEGTLQLYEGVIDRTTKDMTYFRGGKISTSIKNNPGKAPSLTINLPGEREKPIPLNSKPIKITENGETTEFYSEIEFYQDTLQAILRMPELEKGDVDQFTSYGGIGNLIMHIKEGEELKDIPYWSRPYLKTLWRYRLHPK